MAEQVIDASVAVRWVIKDDPLHTKSLELLHTARQNDIALIAPPLFEYEIESVLQRYLNLGRMQIQKADEALEFIQSVGISFVVVSEMVVYARKLARQFKKNAIYDSLNVALAERRGCDFWTADKALYNSVRKELAYVKLLGDFQAVSDIGLPSS